MLTYFTLLHILYFQCYKVYYKVYSNATYLSVLTICILLQLNTHYSYKHNNCSYKHSYNNCSHNE